MRAIWLAVVLVLGACGGGAVPVLYTPPDAGVDAGCVVEGEDGAQFAESTVAWQTPPCFPP